MKNFHKIKKVADRSQDRGTQSDWVVSAHQTHSSGFYFNEAAVMK